MENKELPFQVGDELEILDTENTRYWKGVEKGFIGQKFIFTEDDERKQKLNNYHPLKNKWRVNLKSTDFKIIKRANQELNYSLF